MFVYVLKISFYGDHVIKSGQVGLSIYRFLQFQAILFQLPKCKRKYRRQLLNIVFLQGLDTKNYVTHNLNTIYVTNIRQIGNSFISALHFILFPTTTNLTTNCKKIKIRQKTFLLSKIFETIFVRLFVFI